MLALVQELAEASEWRGPYLKEETALTDPWGRSYLYTYAPEAEVFEVSTLGRDGVEGGDGEDADIRKK